MRNRVEDLGRLMVMIDQVLDMDLFRELDKQTYERTGTDLTILREDIVEAKEKLYECLSICKGQDYLNESNKL